MTDVLAGNQIKFLKVFEMTTVIGMFKGFVTEAVCCCFHIERQVKKWVPTSKCQEISGNGIFLIKENRKRRGESERGHHSAFIRYVKLRPDCPALSCPVLSCPVLSCFVLLCSVLSCPALLCLVLSCPALSCPALFCLVLLCPVLSCFVLIALSCPALFCCRHKKGRYCLKYRP